MRGVAVVAAAVAIAACNLLIGVNDFSTPDCEDCERRECTSDFTACIADKTCAEFIHCLERCASTPCADPCPPPMPTPGTDVNATAKLQACAQTQCTVCAAASAPGPPPGDAATER